MHPVEHRGVRVPGATCPKCGSSDGRRLSLIYEAAVSPPDGALSEQASAHGAGARRVPTPPHLSKQAAPPSRKHDALWSVAALAAMIISVGTAQNPDARTAIASAIVAGAIYFAIRSRRFNRDVFPRLHTQWERSVMCPRCGTVYEA
jgi:ribosomal protein S27AE